MLLSVGTARACQLLAHRRVVTALERTANEPHVVTVRVEGAVLEHLVSHDTVLVLRQRQSRDQLMSRVLVLEVHQSE